MYQCFDSMSWDTRLHTPYGFRFTLASLPLFIHPPAYLQLWGFALAGFQDDGQMDSGAYIK